MSKTAPTIKIEQKITNSSVKSDQPEQKASATIERMHEKFVRPEVLDGKTYKIKPPTEEHAMYVTICDTILNEGTEHERRIPYEIFLNTKNTDHHQWVLAQSRLISAVFRKGGDVTFLVDELKAVHDPRGGYFKKGGQYVPSLVAEIGYVLERHMISIGLLQPENPDQYQLSLIDEKRNQYEEKSGEKLETGSFPASAVMCNKCQVKAVISMDNCLTCLNCGDSKCG